MCVVNMVCVSFEDKYAICMYLHTYTCFTYTHKYAVLYIYIHSYCICMYGHTEA